MASGEFVHPYITGVSMSEYSYFCFTFISYLLEVALCIQLMYKFVQSNITVIIALLQCFYGIVLIIITFI